MSKPPNDGVRRAVFVCRPCLPHRRRVLARAQAAYSPDGVRTGPIEAEVKLKGREGLRQNAIVRHEDTEKVVTGRCPTCLRGPFSYDLERIGQALDIAPEDGRNLRVPI